MFIEKGPWNVKLLSPIQTWPKCIFSILNYSGVLTVMTKVYLISTHTHTPTPKTLTLNWLSSPSQIVLHQRIIIISRSVMSFKNGSLRHTDMLHARVVSSHICTLCYLQYLSLSLSNSHFIAVYHVSLSHTHSVAHFTYLSLSLSLSLKHSLTNKILSKINNWMVKWLPIWARPSKNMILFK